MTLFDRLTGKAQHLWQGENAEHQALQLLTRHGLILVCKNFRCKHGELDLVMQDGPTLVIVEVRYRKSNRHGSASESVTWTKQSRIIAATQIYLATRKHVGPLRFDVVALSGNGDVDWIKNAFSATS